MIIEAHNRNIDKGYTLAYKVSRLAHAREAEGWTDIFFEKRPSVRRYYIYDEEGILAVLAHEEGGLYYIAKHERYKGARTLPYLYPSHTFAATIFPNTERDVEHEDQWGRLRLQEGMTTFIMLDPDGIVAAWENTAAGPALISRGLKRNAPVTAQCPI